MIKDEHNDFLISLALFWAVTITALRALRWPNDWAEAHWLISYSFGFLKRGLPGTLFLPFANENSGLAIKVVSISLFVLFCIVLFWMCKRIIRNSKADINSFLVVLLFLTSPYIVMSAHLNGYFDSILIVISIISCALVKKNKIFFVSILISIGVLIHETIFVIGFPCVLFFSLLQYTRQAKPSNAIHLLPAFLYKFKALILLPLFVFFCVLLNQKLFLNSGEINDQLRTHLSQFDFIERDRNILVPNAFTHSFLDYLHEESPEFPRRITNPVYIIQIGPPLLLLLIYGFHRLQMLDFRWLFSFLLVAITVLPLSLHLIAWDTSRIWTYPLIVAMLGVWGLTEAQPGVHPEKEKSPFFVVLTITVIVLQFFISTPLMDGAHERFSSEERLLLYTPLLTFSAVYMILNFFRTKRPT